MKLTTEQIEQILAGAPDESTHGTSCDRMDHLAMKWGSIKVVHKDSGAWLRTIDVDFEELHNLADLREILTLRQRVEELEAQQSEVAARAVEGFADKFELCTPHNWYIHAKEYADKLREQSK